MLKTEINTNEFRDLALLNWIDADPDVSQAKLADELNIAIGTVNWHLKRMVEQGYIAVKRAKRRKLRYMITTEGLLLQRTLTDAYVQQSFQLYRQVRQQVKGLLAEIRDADTLALRLEGEGDVADICKLTCLEQGITLTEDSDAPILAVNGLDVRLDWIKKES